MRISRYLVLGCLAMAQMAVAQYPSPTPVVTNKPADKTVRVAASAPINTNRFSPQVVEVNGQIKPTRAVKNIIDFLVFDTPETNTLALGGLSGKPSPATPGQAFPAIGATGWVPPDPDVAVGPNHIVAVVNVAIAFFRKDGTKLFEQDLGANGFFSGMGATSFVFDPKCFFDPISKRFFVTACEQDGGTETSKMLLAVSDDADPTGNWFRYRIEAKQTVNGSNFWLDYPGFGHNKDAIMITGNMFGFTGGFNGIQYIVIPKTPLLTGAAPNISYFSLGGGSVQVMRTFDPNVEYLYGLNWTGLSTAMIHAIKDINTTPVLVTTPVAIPSFRRPVQGATSVGGHILDSLDGRIMNVHYRNGRLYGSHTVTVSNSDDTNGSRWYEFNLNGWPASVQNPTVRQAGTVGFGNGTHMWMPAIGVNKLGDIAVVYSRASSTIVADMVTSVRRANDPLGQMGNPITLATSIGAKYGGTSNRWGDYFGVQTDPNDDTTFWGIAMIANAGGGWQTVINSFKVTTSVVNQPASIAKFEGGTATGGLTQILNSDNAYYRLATQQIARTGHVASHISTYTLSSATPASLKFKVEAAAVNRVTLNSYLWNWTTSKWDYVSATPLTGIDKVWEFQAPANVAPYVSGTKQVKLLLRTIMPFSTTYSAVPYEFRTDQIVLTSQQ